VVEGEEFLTAGGIPHHRMHRSVIHTD